jgi:hypothetical protein
MGATGIDANVEYNSAAVKVPTATADPAAEDYCSHGHTA